jgi:hypothetical protein
MRDYGHMLSELDTQQYLTRLLLPNPVSVMALFRRGEKKVIAAVM